MKICSAGCGNKGLNRRPNCHSAALSIREHNGPLFAEVMSFGYGFFTRTMVVWFGVIGYMTLYCDEHMIYELENMSCGIEYWRCKSVNLKVLETSWVGDYKWSFSSILMVNPLAKCSRMQHLLHFSVLQWLYKCILHCQAHSKSPLLTTDIIILLSKNTKAEWWHCCIPSLPIFVNWHYYYQFYRQFAVFVPRLQVSPSGTLSGILMLCCCARSYVLCFLWSTPTNACTLNQSSE